MNTKQIAGITFVTALVVKSVREYCETVKTERAKRKEINAHKERQIATMSFAAGKIVERIRQGGYEGKTIDDVMTDFEFEIITRTTPE